MREIPSNLRKVTKSEKTGNLLVLGRLMYAALFTAVRPSKSETNPKKFQYGTTLLIPAGVDVAALEAEAKALFEGNVPEAKRATTKWKNPLKKTAEDATLAGLAEDYPWFIRPNAKQFDKQGKERQRPEVVGADKKPIDPGAEADETYNGRWAVLSLNPYWYPANDGIAGVSLGLVNVLLAWHDDPLAGGKAKASSDFEGVGDGLDDMANLSEEFA